MEAGSSVTISWSSTNATRCGAWGDWGGWKNLSGSESKQMNTAGHYTFHLTCDTGDGTPNGSCKDSIDVVCSAAQKPTISLSLPTASWLNYNPNFKATVTDPNGDSVRGIFTVTPGVTGAVGNLVASGGTTCYPADCSSGLVLNDGEYFWEAYASDSSDSGCQSDPSSRWLGIDKTAPTGDITHSPASPDTGDTVTFTATGSDALSGLKTIQVYVDGSLKNTCSGSTICAYTGGPYSLGAHTYYAVFTDNANNSLTTSTKNFNVSAIDVTCSFSASPSYNCIPPNFVSTLTAAVTGGTATGNINYQIDCTNNGSIDRTFGPTANLSYAYAGCPAYGANATARVVVTREGVSCTALANLYVSSFDVTPPVANILTAPPYNTQQFSATYDQDGATGPSSSQNVSGSCTWSSSAPAVATINATGLATAVAAGGPATITSTYAPSGDSCTDASAISVGLPVSNFKVLLSGINRAPTASNFNTTESNCCDPNPFALFVWTYGDPDGDFETRYDFQIDNESGFNSPWVVDRTFNVSPVLAPGSQNNQSVNISSAVSPPAGWLGYNIQYWWRVRVWDSQGLSSGWVPLPPLMFKTTKTHRCPVCDFTWSPTSPIPDEDVQFTNTSACYNDSQSVVPCSSFSWSINPATANPSTSVLQNPLVIFSGSGGYTVSLTVTDGSGYTCTTIKSVRISLHLPKWKEI
jgi:PKD repeat protein